MKNKDRYDLSKLKIEPNPFDKTIAIYYIGKHSKEKILVDVICIWKKPIIETYNKWLELDATEQPYGTRKPKLHNKRKKEYV